MTATPFMAGSLLKECEVITPNSQTSTDSYVAITGGDIDARGRSIISATIIVATNAVTWEIYGANRSNFADEVVVTAGASVAVGNAGWTPTLGATTYAYYRIKIKSTAGGSHGVAAVTIFLR